MKENVHILKLKIIIQRSNKMSNWKNKMFNPTLTKINMHMSGH